MSSIPTPLDAAAARREHYETQLQLARLQEENLRLREALEGVQRNDKTPSYSYAAARGDRGRAANAKGEYPPAGQRWLRPLAIAVDALAETATADTPSAEGSS